MLLDYFLLALKNLRKRGLRSWLTMLGIFIGIAAVISLISLGQGLEQAIIGQFASIDPDKLVVENTQVGFGPPGSLAVRKLTDEDVNLIESVSGVDMVIPRLIRVVSAEYNKIRLFKSIASLPEDAEQVAIVYDALNAGAEQGRLLTEKDRGKIVLGHSYLETEDFGKKIRVGTTLKIQGKDFEVIGFLEKTSTFFVNDAILMPEKDLKEILDIGNEIDLIVVQIKKSLSSPRLEGRGLFGTFGCSRTPCPEGQGFNVRDIKNQDKIEQVALDIERAIRKDRNQKLGEEDFSVQTPLQSLSAISTILNIINITITGIAAISLLIGGIGIANTMFASVLERRKEIGIMKSIGARNKDILSIFVIESAFLGLAGGLIGAAIGLGLAFLVSGIASSSLGISLMITISWSLIAGAIIFSLTLGLLFGLLPAFQASRLSPVEALRK